MVQDQPFSILKQFIKFVGVGGFVFAADFSVYSLATYFTPVSIFWANVLAKLVGAVLGFVAHKYITYSWSKAFGSGKQFFRYCLLWLGNMLIANGLLYIGVVWFEAPHMIVKVASDVFIVFLSFYVGRQFVFRRQNSEELK